MAAIIAAQALSHLFGVPHEALKLFPSLCLALSPPLLPFRLPFSLPARLHEKLFGVSEDLVHVDAAGRLDRSG